MITTRPTRRLIIAAALSLMAAPALAQSDAAPSSEERLAQIHEYLNGIESMRGTVSQAGPDGVLNEGAFWLRRPGRLRFEYQEPSEILVIADGVNVAIIDKEFDNGVTGFPLSQTPLHLLLKDEIDLVEDDAVRTIKEEDGQIFLTVGDPEAPDLGEVTLVFRTDPIALQQWIVTDAQGLKTYLALRSADINVNLASNLFVIPDPSSRTGGRQQQ